MSFKRTTNIKLEDDGSLVIPEELMELCVYGEDYLRIEINRDRTSVDVIIEDID